MPQQPVKVFISYSHKDEPYKDTLNTYLTPYERKGIIKIWDDRDILPGQIWDTEIKQAVLNADIVLFLVSPDFMASGHIDSVELKAAMELHIQGKMLLIPIIIRPSDLSLLDLKIFQAVPKDAKPISTWENRDEAWLNVIQQLGKLFNTIYDGSFVLKKASTTTTETTSTPQSGKVSLDQIKKLIQQGDLEQAIKKFLDFTASNNDNLHDQIILQSSRLNGLKKDENMGVIPYERAQLTRNQITNGLLNLLREAEDQDA